MAKKRVRARAATRPRRRPRARLRDDLPSRHVRMLNDELIRDIKDLIESHGMPIDATCDYLGISQSQFNNWARRGAAFADSGEPEEDEVYGRLFMALRAGTGGYRKWLQYKLHTAERYWTKWMTILERRDRANYSRREPQGGEREDYDPQEKYV